MISNHTDTNINEKYSLKKCTNVHPEENLLEWKFDKYCQHRLIYYIYKTDMLSLVHVCIHQHICSFVGGYFKCRERWETVAQVRCIHPCSFSKILSKLKNKMHAKTSYNLGDSVPVTFPLYNIQYPFKASRTLLSANSNYLFHARSNVLDTDGLFVSSESSFTADSWGCCGNCWLSLHSQSHPLPHHIPVSLNWFLNLSVSLHIQPTVKDITTANISQSEHIKRALPVLCAWRVSSLSFYWLHDETGLSSKPVGEAEPLQ